MSGYRSQVINFVLTITTCTPTLSLSLEPTLSSFPSSRRGGLDHSVHIVLHECLLWVNVVRENITFVLTRTSSYSKTRIIIPDVISKKSGLTSSGRTVVLKTGYCTLCTSPDKKTFL